MKIFVYGTLMRNYHNNSLLAGCEYISEYIMPGYKLYDSGFPAAAVSPGDSVKGELWEIPDDGMVLARLDRLESEGYLYHRVVENDISFYVGNPRTFGFENMRECPKNADGIYVWRL